MEILASSSSSSSSFSSSSSLSPTQQLLLSRPILTLGEPAVTRLSAATVAVYGTGPLAADVAKNLLLTGLQRLVLVEAVAGGQEGEQGAGGEEEHKSCEADEAASRGSPLDWLQSLRPAAQIKSIRVNPEQTAHWLSSIPNLSLLVATQDSFSHLSSLNDCCRHLNIPFVAARSAGLSAFVFVDAGPAWQFEPDGSSSRSFGSILSSSSSAAPLLMVESITADCPAAVSLVDDHRHGLQDGDWIRFLGVRGMQGMEEQRGWQVTVTGESTFTIQADTRGLGPYESGGYIERITRKEEAQFGSLRVQLQHPTFESNCCSSGDSLLCCHCATSRLLLAAFDALDKTEAAGWNEEMLGSNGGDEELMMGRETGNAERRQASGASEEQMGGSQVDVAGSRSNSHMTSSSVVEGSGVEPGEGERGRRGSLEEEVVKTMMQDDSMRQLDERLERSRPDGELGMNNGSEEETTSEVGSYNARYRHLVRALLCSYPQQLPPVVSIVAGMAAQEAMKLCSRTLRPLQQWFLLDASHALPSFQHLQSMESCMEGAVTRTATDTADKKRAMTKGEEEPRRGRRYRPPLHSSKLALVGLGSLGCEVARNLLLLGAASAPGGELRLVDDDAISGPNLASQCLFRGADVEGNRRKVAAAAERLRQMNGPSQVLPLEARVSDAEQSQVDSFLLTGVDCVVSCVDSTASRLLLDSKCIASNTPLVDGGKLGLLGSVQVVVPRISEPYSASHDPSHSSSIQICTLNNFPFLPSHTLHWGLQTFNQLFKSRPSEVNDFLSRSDSVQSVLQTSPPQTKLPLIENLHAALVTDRPISFAACVSWARLLFQRLFHDASCQLLFNFPPSMTTSAGAPFWSGSKRCPQPLLFDPFNDVHILFVLAAANLQALVYGLRGCGWLEEDKALLRNLLVNVNIPPFTPRRGVRFATSDDELAASRRDSSKQQPPSSASDLSPDSTSGSTLDSMDVDDTTTADRCVQLLQQLPSPSDLAGFRLNEPPLAADDLDSLAVLFIAAAALLRAANYSIPMSDISTAIREARQLAGAILPAIVTSASVVAGLMVLEICKVVAFKGSLSHPSQSLHARANPSVMNQSRTQQTALTNFKNSFINLASPVLISSAPMPCAKHKVPLKDGSVFEWTAWDHFKMEGKGWTLSEFLKCFQQQYGLEISMLSYGKSLLYAEFMNKQKLQSRLPLKLPDLVESVARLKLSNDVSVLTFSIMCCDSNDDDVEVPDVNITIA